MIAASGTALVASVVVLVAPMAASVVVLRWPGWWAWRALRPPPVPFPEWCFSIAGHHNATITIIYSFLWTGNPPGQSSDTNIAQIRGQLATEVGGGGRAKC